MSDCSVKSLSPMVSLDSHMSGILSTLSHQAGFCQHRQLQTPDDL